MADSAAYKCVWTPSEIKSLIRIVIPEDFAADRAALGAFNVLSLQTDLRTASSGPDSVEEARKEMSWNESLLLLVQRNSDKMSTDMSF